jgi:mRNA interferase MazF
VKRGEIWWIDLGDPQGSGPGFERPCVIVSSNELNDSTLATIIVSTMTSNLKYEAFPGNIRVPAGSTGLRKPSVILTSQIYTVDKRLLERKIDRIPDALWPRLDISLAMAVGLARP